MARKRGELGHYGNLCPYGQTMARLWRQLSYRETEFGWCPAGPVQGGKKFLKTLGRHYGFTLAVMPTRELYAFLSQYSSIAPMVRKGKCLEVFVAGSGGLAAVCRKPFCPEIVRKGRWLLPDSAIFAVSRASWREAGHRKDSGRWCGGHTSACTSGPVDRSGQKSPL